MKKLILNTRLSHVAYLLLVAGLMSCSEYNETEQSRFIVKEVVGRKGMRKLTTYKVLMLDASGIGEADFWMVDTIGKYKVGDKLVLQPYR